MPFISGKWIPLSLLLASACYILQNYRIDGWQNITLEPLSSQSAVHSDIALEHTPGQLQLSLGEKLELALPSVSKPAILTSVTPSSAPVSSRSSIRIASFNVQALNSVKANKAHIVEMIARLCRSFDIVALQEVASNHQDLIPRLVEQINLSGRHFDFMIGPRVGRLENKEQFVFLFDTESIETDRNQLYTVDDPHDLLEFEPLVGWFRTRGVPTNQAFTFTLINVHLDSSRTQDEIHILPDLVRSAHQDGRLEDDVILLGDFNASDRQLSFLHNLGMSFALEGMATNTLGTQMLDNFVFPTRATDEFTGKVGTVDFLREHNLSIDAALEISDHLPVWAEFSTNEGGQPGGLAPSIATQR